jgi:hypothetical protein
LLKIKFIIKKRTPILEQTNRPEWNYKLEFNVRYPPLVTLIKIELCNASNTSSTFDEIVLAKEYLTLTELSNFRIDDALFLPTYGPCYVDLYSRPNNLRVKKQNVDSTVEEVSNFKFEL